MKSLLEWHRWFAWYPVPVVHKGKLRFAWLRFVERKWGTARYSGRIKWRYRPPDAITFTIDRWAAEHQDLGRIPDTMSPTRSD